MRKLFITKKFTFESAHVLPNHPGKCRNLHGHSYKLEVTFSGYATQDNMVIDFSKIKKMVKDLIIDRLDHAYLNDLELPGFPKDNPTAEAMVQWMVDLMDPIDLGEGVDLAGVKLYETETCYVEWKKDDVH